MKKFLSGIIIGAALVCTVVFAATYTAEDASFKIFVEGKEFTESKAVVIDGSTYLPLRALGNVLGVPVNWNNELRQVEIGQDDTDINKAIVIKDKVSVDGFTFSELTIKPNSFMTSCDVEVQNNSGKDIESLYFNISFFDEGGNRIGVAKLGIVSNGLKNGETKTASLYSEDNIKTAVSARYDIELIY